jgi:UDP-glucose 4-epimerase
MKLLITGSAGFIGSHCARAALDRGWDVDGFDLSHPSENKRADTRLLTEIHTDVVLHLAAYSSLAGFSGAMASNYANNVAGCWNVLRLAQQSGARVVYASSSAVYENSGDEDESNSEWTPLDSSDLVSHYAKSKLMNEMMAGSFAEIGVKSLGMRIFNAYGPGDEKKPADRQAPPTWMMAAKRADVPAVIYGNGFQSKDFIHIDDVTEIIMRLIESDATGIVNVGTGVATSFNALAELIMCEVAYRPVPHPESYQYFTRADTTRLRSIIGEYQLKSIQEGVCLS